MPLRRCAILHLEPRERLDFDLAALGDEGAGLRQVIEWVAFAPHLDAEVLLSSDEVVVLGTLSPSRWCEFEELAVENARDVLSSLRDKALLIEDGTAPAARDMVLRNTHWRSASAVLHFASRWRGVDTKHAEQRREELFEGSLLDQLGAAPAPVRERASASTRKALPSAPSHALEDLLSQRVTCRNFDTTRPLRLEDFSSVIFRAFGARAVDDYAPGVQLLKKGVPSAGGLHPTEAYLLVQRVDGIEPGLYHYHPIDHALEPLRMLSWSEATDLARRFVAAQSWFVDAPVLIIPTTRFLRNFWKYRNHAKAYRALILDVGHLSQTLYLAATELGLGAFVTAAINEVDIEEAFGLDPLEEGPLAVCGFGQRGAELKDVEFDPLHVVWPKAKA